MSLFVGYKPSQTRNDRDNACGLHCVHIHVATPMGNYIFTLTPTFTQGLILGQVSILLLVYFILKYLFFDSKSAQLLEEPSEDDAPLFWPTFSAEKFIATAFLRTKATKQDEERDGDSVESAEWLNVLLKQVSGRVPRGRNWVDPRNSG